MYVKNKNFKNNFLSESGEVWWGGCPLGDGGGQIGGGVSQRADREGDGD